MKENRIFKHNKLIFAAFLLPVLLLVLVFVVTGIYPFGDNQIAVIDMYHQYVPFLSELQYKLQEGGSLFYTWHGAGGSNFWNLLAYYGASPLNLLLVLFPKTLIMEGVTAILLIKIGLSGSFMALYLRYSSRKSDWTLIAFSTMYALSSYVMAYYWCIMWMDAVALLPLCILGLNKLIDEGKAVMYTVSLALVVFVNYYIAIMVCIFIMFYYPVLYFTKHKWQGWKHCGITTGRAVGFSFLSIAMSAVMLLPTYISMQSTYYISSELPDNGYFYNDALDILNQTLPYSEVTFREGLPNLYCGILIVMLLVFYITSKSIGIKEKLINGAFLAFMFMSLNINKLDFLWHGMHFPNQLPYRYTFVIIFVIISMAYKAFRRFDEVEPKAIWTVLFAGAAYYLVAQKVLTENIKDMDMFFYGGLIWLALYCAVMLLYKKKAIMKGAFTILIIVVAAAEMMSSALTAIDTIGVTQRTSYFENYRDVITLTEKSKAEFARTEMDDNYILNCPAFYHYRGLSQFSSSINAETTGLMEKIGLDGEPGKNRFNYNETNPVTNAMLNVKYLISKNLPLKDGDFTQIDKSGHSRLYESKYPLSIGYMTGSEIRTWKTDSDNPFEVLDSYVKAVTAGKYSKVFEPAFPTRISSSNMDIDETGYGKTATKIKDHSKDAKAVFEYKADKTQKYYVFIEAEDADDIIVNEEKESFERIYIREDCGSIVNIGEVKEGETFTVTTRYKEGRTGDITCYAASLDYDVWNDTYDMLSDSMMEVTNSGDDFIEGKVNVRDYGILVTSVPYERGWKLEVDGEEREIHELVGGVFIATALDTGEHEIRLSFRPPGLIAGAAISVIAIILLTVYTLIRKRRGDKATVAAKPLSMTQEDQGSLQEECGCSRK